MTITSTRMKSKAVFANKAYRVSAVALVILTAGCSRCEECVQNGNSETICETEFDSTDQYEDAIADQEANGATCTASGAF